MTNENNAGEEKIDGETIKEPEVEKVETPPPRQPIPVTITDIELEQLKKDASEFKDKYLRNLAEMENTRKRLQKERQELTQYAIQNVMVDFLNPIDHMENALKHTEGMPDPIKHWAIGFKMILDQFKDVLNSNGVQPFKSVETHFDPHKHEAVEMLETDKFEPGIDIEESMRGYKMGDRVIRPARVKVSKAPSVKQEELKEENKQ